MKVRNIISAFQNKSSYVCLRQQSNTLLEFILRLRLIGKQRIFATSLYTVALLFKLIVMYLV